MNYLAALFGDDTAVFAAIYLLGVVLTAVALARSHPQSSAKWIVCVVSALLFWIPIAVIAGTGAVIYAIKTFR